MRQLHKKPCPEDLKTFVDREPMKHSEGNGRTQSGLYDSIGRRDWKNMTSRKA